MQEKLMTITELAERLGLTKGHIYNLVNRREIPFIKLSPKVLRFEPTEIDRWIAQRREQRQAIA